MGIRLPEEAHRYIKRHFEAHLECTWAFLRQPSISSQNIGILQCAEILRGWLAEGGAHVEVHGREKDCAVWRNS